MDAIVTTPKSEIETAAREAAAVVAAGGGYYYRTVAREPRKLNYGDRLFYVEDGFIRGFALVERILVDEPFTCRVTGKTRHGYQIVMNAKTWHWIEPIPMVGFQGVRYFDQRVKVVGGWLDPKPPTPQNVRA